MLHVVFFLLLLLRLMRKIALIRFEPLLYFEPLHLFPDGFGCFAGKVLCAAVSASSEKCSETLLLFGFAVR